MRTKGKRILSLALSIVLLLTLLPRLGISAQGALSGECGKYVTWNVGNGQVLTITGYGPMVGYSTASDAPWYGYRGSVEFINIHSGINEIGYKSFCSFTKLTAVMIPDTVITINGYAFYRCTALAGVIIPQSVTALGSNVFYGCSGLNRVIFFGSAPTFRADSFTGVTTTVYYPCGDTSWTDAVKENYGGNITWKANHQAVDGVCTECHSSAQSELLGSGSCGDNLQWQLDIAGTLTITGNGAMSDYAAASDAPWYKSRSSVRAVELGDGVTSIGARAFYEFRGLSEVTIPKGVTTIGTYAFHTCEGLDTVTFLGTAPTIGSGCFKNVTAEICYSCQDDTWTDEVKKNYEGTMTWTGHAYGDYVIREDATCTEDAVAVRTCTDCGTTTRCTVPHTAIGHTFDSKGVCLNCGTGLTIGIYTDYTSSYGDPDWDGCIQIYADGVKVGMATQSWEDDGPVYHTFPYIPCATYTFVWVGDVSYAYAFSIYIAGEIKLSSRAYYFSDGETVFTYEGTRNHRYKAISTAPSCTEDGITGNVCCHCGKLEIIDTTPMQGHRYMETVTAPTCTELGSVLYNCAACGDTYSIQTPANGHHYENGVCTVCGVDENVKILYSGNCGASVRWQVDNTGTLTISGTGPMYDYAHSGMPPWYKWDIRKLITDVEIKSGVTTIGGHAFEDSANLFRIAIPETVTTIGEYAFSYCDKLVTVTVPDSVTQIGDSAFSHCDKLTSVTLPKGLTTISDYMFDDCIWLTSVVIPESVTSFGSSAIAGCRRLTSLTIPAGVTELGSYFHYSSDFQYSVRFLGALPSIGEESFCQGTAIIYYPCYDKTWNQVVKTDQRRNICWVASHSFDESGICTDCGKGSDLIVRMVSTNADGKKAPSIKVFADGEPVATATISGSKSYQTAAEYQHGKAYTFQWVSGGDDSNFCFEILANGKVLCSGNGGNYSDGQTVFTIENLPDHQLETLVTPPTCTEEGFTTKACRYCCASFISDIVPATGHRGGVTITPPTCTENGVTFGVCDVCGYSGIISTTPATGHSYEQTVTPPTCTQEGSTVDTCSICGYSVLAATLPATGHHYDQNGKCEDCTIQFDLTAYMTDNYGDGWNGAGIEVYANDTLMTTVSLSVGSLSGGCPVSCVPGKTYTLKWKSGSADNECGVKITLNGSPLVAGQGSDYADGQILCTFEVLCAHAYETTVTLPTCDKEGFTTGTCTTCGYSSVIETTPANGHHYEDGWCTVCGREKVLADGTCGENLNWSLYENGRLVISGTGPMTDYDIPEEGTDPNTPWYEHRQNITKVLIESGVTTIGAYAFHSCTNLTHITIPESVSTIEKLAFYNCIGLTNVMLPKGITTIGSAAFRRCSSLMDITLPDGLTTIGKIAFYDCTNLQEMTIPASVTSIGALAFANCTGLTTLRFSGPAPAIDQIGFVKVTATGYYPCDDKTWTEAAWQNYGGMMTWKAAHHFGDYIPQDNATCTVDGTAVAACDICGSTEEKTLPGTATGHREKAVTGYAATCTQNGLTDGVQCAVCSEVLVSQQTIPATGHREEIIPGEAATCTRTGLSDGVKCAVCHEVLTPRETLPKLEHDYKITEVSVTCSDYGYEFHQCQMCGYSFYHKVFVPLGHRYENGSCTLCGQTDPAVWDISGDGQLTVVDVATLYAHVKGTTPITDESMLSRADITKDGAVNILDVAALYAYVTTAL